MQRRSFLRHLLQIVLPAALTAMVFLTAGTIQPVQAAAYVDTSLSAIGSNQVGFYNNSNSFYPSSGDYTAEIWARRDGTYAANTRYSMWMAHGKYLYVYNNNFWWRHDDGTDTDTGVAAPKDEWFHVAIVVTSSTKTVKLVLNGASTSWSKTFATLSTSITFSGIGTTAFVSPYNFWQGQLDQFKVWTSALSDAQIAQSMNTYQATGITGSPSLNYFADMNAGSGSITPNVGAFSLTVTPAGSTPSWVDVKTTDTTSRPGLTIYGFPRTYLTAQGGWKAPTGMGATYQYLSVAGGGGGGSSRGGGGGAGGLTTGTVSISSSAVFAVVVGAGGYANVNGGDTKLQNINASSPTVSSVGGGAGGNSAGTMNGANGGSGGGAALCYAGTTYPTGGTGASGQGFNGASNDTTNCLMSPNEVRATGGGGGSSAAGVAGAGGDNNPNASTAGQTRPNGGAGTSSSITGAAVTYAAGGGGAVALASTEIGFTYSSAYFGLGGSSIGGNGAVAGGVGSAATPNTGSGGGGGGYSPSNYLYTGGMGSNGVLYLVATPGPALSTPASGASLNRPVVIQPTFSVASGAVAVTACSAVDANGNSAGVSVTCTAASGTGSVSLTDLTFTSGTLGQVYTLIFTMSGADEVRQEITLWSMPSSLTIASTGATSNFVWDGGTLMATSDNQTVTILNTDVQTKLNSTSLVLNSVGVINVNAAFTGTTSGNGVIFKSAQYVHAASTTLTTANGAVTIWNTNPNVATGTTGITGVLFNTSSIINTNGGAITIGGGNNPLTTALTAEVGVNMGSTAKLQATGGNISIRADSVLNANLNTANDQMKGIFLSGGNVVSTTGNGTITIASNGNGAANGYRGLGFAMAGASGMTGNVSAANGNITITGGNLGSGNVIPVAIGLPYNGAANYVQASGTGSISITGDGRGTTTTSTPSANGAIYGVLMNYSYGIVTSVDGNVSVTGYGGNTAASTTVSTADSVGVYTSGGQIQSTGLGSVTIYGQGGNIAGTVSGRNANSIGIYSSSWLGTTSNNLLVQGKSGTVSGAVGSQYGFWGTYASSMQASYNPGALLTTTGNISLVGDTAPVPSGSPGVYTVGIYSSPTKIKSTSGNISIVGTACSTCTANETSADAKGINIQYSSSGGATWPEITTGGSGTITMTGSAEHEVSTVSAVYGITAGFEGNTRASIKTTAGAISISGTSSGGNQGYGVSLGSGMASTTTGALTITGSSTTTGGGSSGVRVGATYNLATQSGNIGVTGSALGTNSSYGVQFSTGNATTTSGNFTVNGTSSATNATNNVAASLSTYPVTTDSGAVAIVGTNSGATTSFATALNIISSNIKTTTGAITLQGLSPNTASGSATGIGLSSSSITSGDSATSTTGGSINITAKVAEVASGAQIGMNMNNASIDSYNSAVTVLVNDPMTTTNSSRNSLSLNATNTWAATSATFDLTVNGLQGGKILMQETSSTLNIGGTNSHANVTVKTDGWHKSQVAVLPVTNIDTDGSFVVQPIGASFLADMFNTGSPTTDAMKVNFSPSSRTTSMTIGKSGNTRAITLEKAVTMASNSIMKVYGASLTSSNTVSVGTLAVESSGNVSLTGASNSFANVAVTRGAASTLSITNTATSWNAGTYGGITGVYGVPAAFKASGTPPSTATLGSAMATYTVLPTDAYGYAIASANTHFSDAVTATASVKTGASTSLGGTTSQTGTAGAALVFNDLTFSNPGVHTLAFDATGYAQYVSPNITVSGGSPTISLSYFSGTNATTFVSNTTTASPTLTKNSTGAATYSSNTISVCTVVSATGVITTKTPGTCSITVSVAADSTYLSGSQTVSITIDKMAQAALTITSTSGSYGAVLTLATSGGNAGAVTYVVDSGTCTLATSTTLNLGAVGDSCMVTATRAGDVTYAPVSSTSTSIATNKGTQAGLVTPSGITISYLSAGLDLSTLTYTGGSGTGSIGFSTATTGCSINGTTLTSTNTVGGTSCSISAVKAGDASYNTGSPSVFTVAISKANQAALSVTSTSATYGQTLSLTYSGGSGTGAITFALVSGSCTVSGTTLTPTAATSCVVKVTKALDTNYNVASSADTTVTIAKANQASLSVTSVSGAFGATLSLTTSGGTDSGSVSYVVDSGTCSLATATTLTLGNVGDSCMVTATKASTSNYNAVSSSSTSIATVKANQAALIAPSGVTLVYSDSNGLDLTTVSFTGGSGSGSISFTTSTSGCAIASGILTSTNNAATTCVVASTKAGDASYNTGIAVNLTVTITKATQASLVISTTTGTYGTALTLNTTGGTDTGAVTYVKDSGTCTLAAGVLTLGNAGSTCMVTATKAATTNYNAISSASTSIITSKANQATLTITSTSGTYNTALTLTTSGGTDTGAVTYAVDSGTCVVSGTSLTLGNAGDTCYVTATKATTTNYNATSSVSTSISTGRAAQAALVAPTGVTLTYGDTSGLNLTTLTFTGGSGTGSLIFSTSTSGCSIASNVITSTNNAATTCVVATNKAGDSNYSASASVNLTITITKAAQASLTITTTSATYATTLSLQTSGGSGGGAVSYSVVSGVCTIAGTTLTPTGAGTCVISATKATDTNYTAISSSNTTVNIARGSQSTVSISNSTSISYSGTLTLSATGGSSSATGYVFATSTSGCSVSGGVLSTTLGATSTCAISAYKVGDSDWLDSNTATATITVIKANQVSTMNVPSGVTLTYNNQTGLDLTTLNITGGSGTGAYLFTATTVGCNISNNVLTTANLANSNCLIDVVKAADANYNASPAGTLTVSIVTANQPAITVTSTSATFGQTLMVAYTGGIGTGAVTYSATGTCSVDGSGVLTFTAAGATGCSVTVSKAAEVNKYNAASSSATTVAVAKGNQTAVSFTSATTIPYAGSLSLTASGGSSTAVGYVFSTSTTNCTVSSATLTSTLPATNSCAVSVYKVGDTNWNDSATATTTVTIAKANQAAVGVPTGTSIVYANGSGVNLSLLTYTGGSGSGSLSFASSTSGCTISTATLTTTNNAGTTCTVVVTKGGDANYNASTGVNMTVTINKATQAALSITTLSATYGANLTLATVGGTSNGALNFAKVSGSCTIAGDVLTPTGAGTCVVTATMAGGTNYTDVTSSNHTVTIAKANQSPLVLNMATSVSYLGALALTTSGGSGTGNVVFSVSQNSACSITGTNLTPLDVGSTCEVLATKLGDSNYNSIDATSVQITTTPINQMPITFNSASVMTYGQTLSVSAIGGSGSGTVSYSVNNQGTTGCSLSGTTLSVTASGTCVVAAVKASSLNYNTGATVTQSITVNKAAQTTTFTSTVPGSPIVGSTYTVAASSTSGTAPTFSIASGNCTIAASVVTFTGTGNCRIDANTASTSQYLAAPVAWQTVAIGQRNQLLTFDAATLAVTSKTFGDPAFAAVATSSIAGLNPVYSRGAATTNNACLVSSSGLVTIVAVGVCQIQADQAGDANTAAATPETKNFNVVADVANAPTIVSVSAGHESITAAFVKPSYTGGAVISGYQLVATHAGGTETFSGCSIVAGNDQSCTISGLTNGTSYTLKVAAINSAGVGVQSAASASRVPATNPAAVQAFTAVPDNTTLQLSWSLPVSLGGGTFDSYRIFIKPSTDANYPSTYTTVNSMATLSYQFTNLLNGQAYDAMIVTVTTANTLALVSNTAEVRETPRTVPDAPASILIFEVGSNLVVSWTSPLADGGNAISEYAASIGGTPCVLATPTDTTCSITTPTAAGVYAIEVKAKNAAGYGQAVTGNFTKIAAVIPPPPVINPGNGGNEYVANPRIPMLVLGISSSKASTAGGTVLTFNAKNMEKLTEVLVSGIKAKIISASKTQVKIQMPKHALGHVTLHFVSPNGTLDLVDAVVYVNGVVKASQVTIKNFIQENATLSVAAKKSLRTALEANPGVTSVTCVGYQSWSYDRPLDAFTALQRAKVACGYLKSLKKSLVVKTSIARTTLEGPASRKLEVIFK